MINPTKNIEKYKALTIHKIYNFEKKKSAFSIISTQQYNLCVLLQFGQGEKLTNMGINYNAKSIRANVN